MLYAFISHIIHHKSKIFYPCFCLKRGFFLLITYRRPFLLTILQSALRFFIEALTFIFIVLIYLLIARSRC